VTAEGTVDRKYYTLIVRRGILKSDSRERSVCRRLQPLSGCFSLFSSVFRVEHNPESLERGGVPDSWTHNLRWPMPSASTPSVPVTIVDGSDCRDVCRYQGQCRAFASDASCWARAVRDPAALANPPHFPYLRGARPTRSLLPKGPAPRRTILQRRRFVSGSAAACRRRPYRADHVRPAFAADHQAL